MGFFRKQQDEAVGRLQGNVGPRRRHEDEAIADFWAWWTSGVRERLAAAFDDKDLDTIRVLGPQVAERVTAIHDDLEYETGAGTTARHVLVVTPGASPQLRGLAERWIAAAPPADESFEYDTWRRPVDDPSGIGLRLNEDTAVEVAEMTVTVAPSGGGYALVVWHPSFPDLPENVKNQINFLLLNAVLGERVLREKIDAVEFADADPESSSPLVELRGLLG